MTKVADDCRALTKDERILSLVKALQDSCGNEPHLVIELREPSEQMQATVSFETAQCTRIMSLSEPVPSVAGYERRLDRVVVLLRDALCVALDGKVKE